MDTIETTATNGAAGTAAATTTATTTAAAVSAAAAEAVADVSTAIAITFAPVTSVASITPSIAPDALAASLAQAPPSAGILGALAFERLSPTGQLEAVVAWERLVRHAHAGLVRALSALAAGAGDERWLAESEVCAALAWSPATAQYRLGEAHALTRLFPETLQQLADGRVSVEQARCLAQLTNGLDDATAHAVETRVLPRMPGQSVAVTRQAIRRAIQRADPQAAAQRHRYERARRRVELRAEDDGMATLSFYLPADVAQMAMRTLTELAQRAKRKNKTSSDKRTLDQRRADLLPALLHSAATGGTFGAASAPVIPARVNVVVGIETLLGLSHEPGHLEGYGPICPEQTRRIAHAHAARWRFLLTATDGTLVHASPRTYTPSAAVKRLTELKHTTCAFPHCAMPADRCDLDHNRPYGKGGPTTTDNLAPLCRKHHIAKTRRDWDLHRTGDIITWTSIRTGRSYTTTSTRYQPIPVAA